MNTTFLKSIAGTALALLMLTGGLQISVSGQSDEGHESSLVGVWATQVTRRNCETGGVVRAALTLDETGDHYTATATNDVLDVNGNVIGNGCATSVSTRFQ